MLFSGFISDLTHLENEIKMRTTYSSRVKRILNKGYEERPIVLRTNTNYWLHTSVSPEA